MRKFLIVKDGSDNTFTPVVSDSITNKVYVANVAQDFTVPAGAKYILFSTTVNFYVKWNGSGAATTDADVELNPSQKSLGVEDTLITTFSIVSADAGNVCFQYYG